MRSPASLVIGSALALCLSAAMLPAQTQTPTAAPRPAQPSARRATPPVRPVVAEERPGMLRRAKVTPDSAMTIALARVPGGRIQKAEIEQEDGKLIYTFDIKVQGRRGIREINVDALTGAVVATEDEDDPAPAAPAATPAPRRPR